MTCRTCLVALMLVAGAASRAVGQDSLSGRWRIVFYPPLPLTAAQRDSAAQCPLPLPSTEPQPDSILGYACLTPLLTPDTALVDFDTVRVFTHHGPYDGDLGILFGYPAIARQLERFYNGRRVTIFTALAVGDSIVLNMPPHDTEWYIQLRGRRSAQTASGVWFWLATQRHPGRFRMTRESPGASSCLTTR